MIVRRNMYRAGHVIARPTADTTKSNFAFTGQQTLDLGGGKPALIYVPPHYNKSNPPALAIMLHGAGGTAEQGLSLLKQFADRHNMILVATASQDYSWDIIAGKAFGQDVMVLDLALEFVFNRFTINPAQLAIGGFSDGASYALSIGLSNGDLFTHIIAFSPGFYHAPEHTGAPKVFISHGTKDQVLPIANCSRRIVPQLKNKELAVDYHEFDGAHTIPDGLAQEAVAWFTASENGQ
jgi:phospholipase/carboxylesterase